MDTSSRKRPPQEKINERNDKEYNAPPARKQQKKGKHQNNSRRSSQPLIDTSPASSKIEKRDECNRKAFNGPESISGRNGYVSGNHRNSQVSEERSDLREFLTDKGTRTSDKRYRHQPELFLPYDPREDFPPDRRSSFDDFRRPLLPAPSRPLPLLPPSHKRGPLLHSPAHLHNRRYSDISDWRPDFRTRSDDYYEHPYGHRRHRTLGDGGYMSERGFRGSEHTAHMLDVHDRRYSGYDRY